MYVICECCNDSSYMKLFSVWLRSDGGIIAGYIFVKFSSIMLTLFIRMQGNTRISFVYFAIYINRSRTYIAFN
jgi:hypothetical protein